MTNPLKYYFKSKVCKNCKREFIPSVGNQLSCPNCILITRKKYKQQWAQEHKELINERSKLWHKNNLGRSRELKRNWNWKNREKHNAYPNKSAVLTSERRKEISARTTARRKMKRYFPNKICVGCINSDGRIEVHHKDFDPFNNSLENLEYRCKRCHTNIHHDRRLDQATNQEIQWDH